MSKFRRECRGQFVILAAVIIAAFMFSLIHTIGQIGTSRQEVAYEPIDELILAITSDFERCLTRALAKATHVYNESGSIESAKDAGRNLIKNWINSALESYGGFGLSITTGDVAYYYLSWEGNLGRSQVLSQIGMDVKAYGLKGLLAILSKRVELYIIPPEDNRTIKFLLYQGGKEGSKVTPIPNLTKDRLWIKINNTDRMDFSLTYLGQGLYVVNLSSPINFRSSNITVTAKTPEDDIIVRASWRPPQSLNPPNPPEGGNVNWSTLYLARNGTQQRAVEKLILTPNPETRNGTFGTPRESYGQDKKREIIIIKSPPTPSNFAITLAPIVNVTLFMEASREKIAINVTVAFGYYLPNGTYVDIGSKSVLVKKEPGRAIGCYDKDDGLYFEVPEYKRIVLPGSVFVLKIDALFLGGSGTLSIWFGGDTQSMVELYK